MKYKMMTAKEAIDLLFTLPSKDRNLDFTFDDLDVNPDCDPEGWYGIKMTRIFDEFDDVFAIGYWGGGSTVAYDIYNQVDNSDNHECIKEFCATKLQKYMDDFCDSSDGCKKICVEVKED